MAFKDTSWIQPRPPRAPSFMWGFGHSPNTTAQTRPRLFRVFNELKPYMDSFPSFVWFLSQCMADPSSRRHAFMRLILLLHPPFLSH